MWHKLQYFITVLILDTFYIAFKCIHGNSFRPNRNTILKLLTTKGFSHSGYVSNAKGRRKVWRVTIKNKIYISEFACTPFKCLECLYLLFNWCHSIMPQPLVSEKQQKSSMWNMNSRFPLEVCSIIDNIEAFPINWDHKIYMWRGLKGTYFKSVKNVNIGGG